MLPSKMKFFVWAVGPSEITGKENKIDLKFTRFYFIFYIKIKSFKTIILNFLVFFILNQI